jgi:hypothetical protein
MYLNQCTDCLLDGLPGLDSRSSEVHLRSHVMVAGALSTGAGLPGVRLATHLHLVSRLRIFGAIVALPPHLFMT